MHSSTTPQVQRAGIGSGWSAISKSNRTSLGVCCVLSNERRVRIGNLYRGMDLQEPCHQARCHGQTAVAASRLALGGARAIKVVRP
jgi:hypothetical protein